MKRLLNFGICLIVAMAVLLLPAYTRGQGPAQGKGKVPKLIIYTTYSVGSGAYVTASGHRKVIEKYTPMKVRLEPYADDPGRVAPLRHKEAHFSIFSASTAYPIAFGTSQFAMAEWGPQPIRRICIGNPLHMTLVARASSDIKKFSDLKGKKVPTLRASPGSEASITGLLAFGGLTRKDVVNVPFSGWGDQSRSVIEGVCDVFYDDPPSPVVAELASTRYGARCLPVNFDNIEGWARLRKFAPWFVPEICPEKRAPGRGLPAEGLPTATYNYELWGYDWLNDEVVYQVLKALERGYDEYKDMHKYCEFYRPWEGPPPVDKLSPNPFHPGAIKYYKELGKWTGQHAKWQEEKLRIEKARMDKFKADPAAWQAKYSKVVLAED